MNKILVVYYSFEGSTKLMAETIAENFKADIMEIKPVKEVKSKGFGKFIWGGGQVLMGKKPELAPFSKNIEDYDVILVGTPIWAGTYAPPIKTLLEEDFISGKKVAYFYCDEGGAGKAIEKAKEAINKNNTFIGGKEFVGVKKNKEQCIAEAKKWAGELNLI